MRNYLIILLSCFLGFAVSAENENVLFEKANGFYQKGDYPNAVKTYQEIVKSGEEAPGLYFNLGNAYYKQNNLPAAILNYERALKLAPGDEDAAFNLKMANLKVVDKIVPIPQLFFKRWWNSVASLFSDTAWAIFSVLMAFSTSIMIILFMLSRSVDFKKVFLLFGFLSLMLGVFAFVFAGQQNELLINPNTAIIFESSVYVKGSPDSKSTDLFILHEGTKVTILDELGEWKRIRLANGNEGWLSASAIQVI